MTQTTFLFEKSVWFHRLVDLLLCRKSLWLRENFFFFNQRKKGINFQGGQFPLYGHHSGRPDGRDTERESGLLNRLEHSYEKKKTLDWMLFPIPNQQRTFNKLLTELRCRNFLIRTDWACKSAPNVQERVCNCVCPYTPTELPPLVVGYY